jgi:hypothetical protein
LPSPQDIVPTEEQQPVAKRLYEVIAKSVVVFENRSG